jgi:hypothetical protein
MLWVLVFGLLLVAAEYALAITSRSHPENARQTEFGGCRGCRQRGQSGAERQQGVVSPREIGARGNHVYWTAFEDEALSCLRDNGPMPPAELGRRLRISSAAATSLVAMLARDGKVQISLVDVAGEPRP